MFIELKKKGTFKNEYFDLLKYRLAYSSLEIEGIDDNLASAKQSLKINQQLEAINFAFDELCDDEIDRFHFNKFVCDIEDKVTGGELSNFRKTVAVVQGSNVERSKPQNIPIDMIYLIDDYLYQISRCKTDHDFFVAEANFHIRFLHIHPFEDGNGRCARILLAYNLCRNDLAPCIITKEAKKEYCDLIEKGDVEGLANMFEKLSKEELDVMISLYMRLDERGLIKENKMNKRQEAEYEKIKKH